jgi:hypothetical protein
MRLEIFSQEDRKIERPREGEIFFGFAAPAARNEASVSAAAARPPIPSDLPIFL